MPYEMISEIARATGLPAPRLTMERDGGQIGVSHVLGVALAAGGIYPVRRR